MQKNEVERRLAQLGRRLRALRLERGLSLLDVERMSEGALKGVVIGSYERGDRNVTITRLTEIAAFYGVRLGDLASEMGADRSAASAVEAALAEAAVDARVTEWHHRASATRGVTIRLTEADAQRLADVVHLSEAGRLAEAGYQLHSGFRIGAVPAPDTRPRADAGPWRPAQERPGAGLATGSAPGPVAGPER